MPEPFVQPLSGLTQGFSQGVGLTLQLSQVKEARQQKQREADFNMMQKGIEIANLKGVSADTRAKVLNNAVAPVWNKYNPKSPFPTITGENVNQYDPVIKNSFNLLEQARGGKVTHQFAFDEGMKQWATAVNGHSEPESDQEKAARETSVAALTKGVDQSGGGPKPPSPADAAKRVSELQASIAGIDKADKVTIDLAAQHPELAGAIGKPLTPEMKQQVFSAYSNEIQTLNTYLPTKFTGITTDEYNKLRKAGHSAGEIFGSNLYLKEPLSQ
jgi:hypothetical protein